MKFNQAIGTGRSLPLLADKKTRHKRSLLARHLGISTHDAALPFEPLESRLLLSTSYYEPYATFPSDGGAVPVSGLVMDSSGNLYGTTYYGGTKDMGTVFKIAAGTQTITTLASFNGANGANPWGRLTLDANGNLYGTTTSGGNLAADQNGNGFGTIFKIAAGTTTITTIAMFNGYNGLAAQSALVVDAAGNIYGTTTEGGKLDSNSRSYGTIFTVKAGTQTITTLTIFAGGVNGSNPMGDLYMDAQGNLYGTTAFGGNAADVNAYTGYGTIFTLPKGASTITTLATLSSDVGANPRGGLTVDASGNFYAAASAGGANGKGSIFTLPTGSHSIQNLFSFNGTNGQQPYNTLVIDENGDLFGTTLLGGSANSGTIFKFDLDSKSLTTMASLDGAGNGAEPYGGLLSAGGGKFYGTTAYTGFSGQQPYGAGFIYEVGFTDSLYRVYGKGLNLVNGDTTPSATDNTEFGLAPINNLNGFVTRTYTIQSLSSGQVDFGNVTISGANAGDFIVTTQPASSTTQHGSTTFTISFRPTTAGLKTARITFTSSDATQSSFSFDIQGTGVVAQDAQNGLQILTTQAGSGPRAATGHTLSVLYTGTLLNGNVFDASSLHGNVPFSVKLGTSNVIAGWHQGLIGMQVGEKRILIIPAPLAYGATGSGSIPPNATIVFEVQLLAITDPVLGVTGRGQAISTGDTTPAITDGTDFGSVKQGTSKVQTFTISNLTGNGTLTLTGNTPVTISGPDADQFVVTQPKMGATQSGTFTISYRPKSNKTAVATITIASNDPITPSFSFTVTGSAMIDLQGTFAANLNMPVSVTTGKQISIPITVKNTGGNLANGMIDIVVKASTDGTWKDSDYTLATLTNVAVKLASNGSKTYILTATIPDTATLPLGNYKLLAMIGTDAISESSTANNLVSLKGTAPVTMNVTPPGANLTTTVDASKLNLSTYVPGDTIKVPITITNMGNEPAIGTRKLPIRIVLRASTNGTYSDDDPMLAQVWVTSTIAAGKSVTVYATFVLPSTIAPGSIFLTALADASQIVTEFDDTDNAGTSVTTLNVDWRFGSIPGRHGSVPLTFTDADGTRVTLKLKGPGTGTLSQSGAHYDIQLTNTTAATTFTISTVKSKTIGDDGRVAVRHVTIGNTGDNSDRTSIGAISAATADLTGNITATGAIGSLKWGKVLGPGTLSIGAAAGKSAETQSVSLSFDTVEDLTIQSDIGISALKAVQWTKTDDALNLVTAPWLGTLIITGNKARGLAGNFMADLQLTAAHGLAVKSPTLTSAAVAGSVGNSNWSISGNAKSIAVGRTEGASISATGNMTTLVLTAANVASTIDVFAKALGAFTVTGDLVSSAIRIDGSIGPVRVRSLSGTLLFAGVKPAVTGLPESASDFISPDTAKLFTITSLTITGFAGAPATAVLTNSCIAAGFIKTVKFPRNATSPVDSAGAVTEFGFATLLPTASYTGPASAGLFVSPATGVIS